MKWTKKDKEEITFFFLEFVHNFTILKFKNCFYKTKRIKFKQKIKIKSINRDKLMTGTCSLNGNGIKYWNENQIFIWKNARFPEFENCS